MGTVTQEAIDQFKALMDQAEEPLKKAFQHIHQGYPTETLARFLKAREGNVTKAHKMLVDSLKWRVESEIENMLAKPIVPTDLYRAVRDSQLIGLSGYSREGLPVFAIGVGLSTLDKASVHYYVQSHIQINEYRDCVILPSATKKYGRHISKCLKVLDMTGLKLSALSQIKLLSIISTIDDLNYPEKTLTYYIVNAPYIFSACWKVVKPLLHERTRKKIQVLSGSGQDDLLKIMDYASLPHFCRREGSGSSKHSQNATDNCYSLDHPFHQALYNYIKQQHSIRGPGGPIKQGSAHVGHPDLAVEEVDIAKTLEAELLHLDNRDGLHGSLGDLKINDDQK
ncbi:phosphatidylinositol/phosphatidylcholine transfer protein SFH9-like isoform X1 [Camellia sinensis]|uniref:phosphatidylinositol/phosphatidylcholine transfer protein SFH9-like isoform X1 n=1 Tax=Camellia sinensis TaxID=4442 RepID=UPI0010362B44|nr:phosphatidylinositol/phosphatidylcholine transfer protein SFH9-like isoform X1 [Camellia sinensis]